MQALELFHQARRLFDHENNHAWIATIDLYQALVYYRDHRLDEALQLCRRALDFFAPSPLFTKSVLCQLLLARIHLDRGEIADARQVCLAALDRLEQAETPALSYQAWYVLGVIEEAMGAPDAAWQAYLKAHLHMENLRSHLQAEEMKIAFLKDKLEVYEALVRMCLDRDRTPATLETAFAYIEEAKSRSLADLIAFRSQGLPASRKTERALVDQVNALRGELNWYSRTIQLQEGRAANLMAPQLVKLRRAARDCEHRLVEALASLRVEDAEYSNLQTAGSVPIETIRAALPDGRAAAGVLLRRQHAPRLPALARQPQDRAGGECAGAAPRAAASALPALQIPPRPGLRQTLRPPAAGRHQRPPARRSTSS